MRLRLSCFLLLLTLSNPVLAEIRAKDYEQVKNSEMFKTYIQGVGIGISWANSALAARNQPLLYCQPSNLALGADNYLDILARQMKEAEMTKKTTLDTPLESVLLEGLMRIFPCH